VASGAQYSRSPEVATTLKNSVYAELKGAYSDMGLASDFDPLKSPLQITNKTTGVTFLFHGLDDVEKIKSIKNVDRIWIEEATELDTIEELDQLRLRVRGFKQKQITLSYNPINKFHWLNTEIHDKLPPKHRIFKSTYRDNLKLLEKDPEYGEYIESLKETNPNYYKVYGLGEWGQNAEGLIFPDYTVVNQMPPTQFYGLDIGYTDPCALIEGCVVDVQGQAKKDLYLSERLYMTHLTDNELIEQFKIKQVSKNIPMVCDNASPATIEALRQAGYFVTRSTKGPGSVLASIKQVLEYNIKILAGSKELIKEISNYSWANRDGQWLDEPQDGADHCMAAIRYAVRGSRFFPRAEEMDYQHQRELSVPPLLRYENIETRMPFQPVEQTEREIRSHDAFASLAEMLKRKKEEESDDSGYFNL
jgi:phage terminase large subunit